jgi:hypothetical protein
MEEVLPIQREKIYLYTNLSNYLSGYKVKIVLNTYRFRQQMIN